MADIETVKRGRDWLLMGALAGSIAVDVWAWLATRKRSRNWDKAIAEDLEKAKADASVED